jgi:hypothetical protein
VVFISTFIYGCHSLTVKLNEGERLYKAKCSSCHNIIAPSRHNMQSWRFYVDKYGKNMTDIEKMIVLKYLEDSKEGTLN